MLTTSLHWHGCSCFGFCWSRRGMMGQNCPFFVCLFVFYDQLMWRVCRGISGKVYVWIEIKLHDTGDQIKALYRAALRHCFRLSCLFYPSSSESLCNCLCVFLCRWQRWRQGSESKAYSASGGLKGRVQTERDPAGRWRQRGWGTRRSRGALHGPYVEHSTLWYSSSSSLKTMFLYLHLLEQRQQWAVFVGWIFITA